MLDHALEFSLCDLLKADTDLSTLHYFTGHDDEEHHLPAITASAKSEPLAGSSEVFRGELTLLIESEAHDSKPEQHAAMVDRIRTNLAHRREVAAAINATGQVHLYGYAATATDPNVDATKFRTALTFKIGYGVR